jgi:queuine tRNA-ribosyltransferase
MQFKLESTDIASQARAGTITLDHGIVETPIFMPQK